VIGTVAEVVLGGVFLLAGASKVVARRDWPAQAAQLGAPSLIAPVVPWWEIVVGALLAVDIAAPWPAVAAAATLVVFTALLMRLIARGEHPPCACFGGFSARPIGWRHVARNAVFLALAVCAVVTA
jgi:uncharacterized membrane protein YphA (DoxX/SURF4 family)